MSTLLINLPDSVRERVEHFAREDGVSVDDFLATVIAQRVAVAEADSYIQRRGAKGSSERMVEALRRVPDIEPDPCDRMPIMGEQGADDQSATADDSKAD